jgi:hypothetical protein
MSTESSIVVCKYTDKSSYKLTNILLEMLYKEAKKAGKEAVLELTIENKDKGYRWIVNAKITKEK